MRRHPNRHVRARRRVNRARHVVPRNAPRSRRSRELGSVSIVVVAGSLILCLSALAAADLGSMLLARSRAQASADGAALAAAVEQASILGVGDEPEDAAREYARHNDAEVLRCDCETGSTFAEVEVAVTPRITFVNPWRAKKARAVARAELDPAIFSYRDDRSAEGGSENDGPKDAAGGFG